MQNLPWKTRWANRLFNIFISQKNWLFLVSMTWAWFKDSETVAVTAVSVFGGVKALDYATRRWTPWADK